MISRLQGADINLLRVFVAVARSRGFSAASVTLNVGQSTISTQIKQLEERIGFPLCTRGRAGFQLTPAGERVFEAAQVLERQMAEFVARNAELAHQLHGALRIGVSQVLSRHRSLGRLPDVLSAFSQEHPAVTVELEIGSHAEVEDAVDKGIYDVAWAGTRVQGRDLQTLDLCEMPAHLYCGSTHALFHVADADITDDHVGRESAVIHQFDTFLQRPFSVGSGQLTSSSEVSLFYILSGRYIGYLSDPVAEPWISLGELRPLNPARYKYSSPGGLIFRRSALSNPLVDRLVQFAASLSTHSDGV
jgi:DNA-binding transcriptional LysR family regulator